MARKREILPPTIPLSCDRIYLAKQTLLLISRDSIKMMCGCSSQVAMLDVSYIKKIITLCYRSASKMHEQTHEILMKASNQTAIK